MLTLICQGRATRHLDEELEAMQSMGTLPRIAVIAPTIDIPSGGAGAADDSFNPRRIVRRRIPIGEVDHPHCGNEECPRIGLA